MKKRLLALLPLLALAACQTAVPYVHKTGTTFAERQADTDACRVTVLQQIPQHSAVATVQPLFGPPVIQSFDPNKDLRTRQVGRCLVGKGYQILQRPICAPGSKHLVSDPQPPARDIKCIAGRRL
ncbi:hypothetical protein [Roseibium sp.]|uniref:hypothetical protein n=1 Tax=Roseibium sp. TaxID=1936156 RepID=UPI003BAA89EE